MTIILTPGAQHETTVFKGLMEQGAVRCGSGRQQRRPDRLAGDKAYSSRKIREYLHKHGIGVTIPRRKNEHRTGPFNKAIYRQRNKIERLINRLKQFRRLATRYEKRAENYRAMWVIGFILLWL